MRLALIYTALATLLGLFFGVFMPITFPTLASLDTSSNPGMFLLTMFDLEALLFIIVSLLALSKKLNNYLILRSLLDGATVAQTITIVLVEVLKLSMVSTAGYLFSRLAVAVSVSVPAQWDPWYEALFHWLTIGAQLFYGSLLIGLMYATTRMLMKEKFFGLGLVLTAIPHFLVLITFSMSGLKTMNHLMVYFGPCFILLETPFPDWIFVFSYALGLFLQLMLLYWLVQKRKFEIV